MDYALGTSGCWQCWNPGVIREPTLCPHMLEQLCNAQSHDFSVTKEDS